MLVAGGEELKENESIEDIMTDGNHIFLSGDQNQITIFDPTNHKLTANIEIPELVFATILVDNTVTNTS